MQEIIEQENEGLNENIYKSRYWNIHDNMLVRF